MNENLEILIRQCQANQRKAQAEIYQRFSPTLFAVCLRYSNNYEDAQDVFQDGFIQIFKKIEQFRFQGSFEGWMRRIMVNSCIERHRKKNHLYVINEEITIDENTMDFDSSFDDESDEYSYTELLEIIQRLPNRYQQVFNLYVFEEFTHQQIADLLEISVGTSKSNLSRAREKLMEMIKKNTMTKIVAK